MQSSFSFLRYNQLRSNVIQKMNQDIINYLLMIQDIRDSEGYFSFCSDCQRPSFQISPNYSLHGQFHRDKSISASDLVNFIKSAPQMYPQQCEKAQILLKTFFDHAQQQIIGKAHDLCQQLKRQLEQQLIKIKIKTILDPKGPKKQKIAQNALKIIEHKWKDLTCDDVYQVHSLTTQLFNKIGNENFANYVGYELSNQINTCLKNAQQFVQQIRKIELKKLPIEKKPVLNPIQQYKYQKILMQIPEIKAKRPDPFKKTQRREPPLTNQFIKRITKIGDLRKQQPGNDLRFDVVIRVIQILRSINIDRQRIIFKAGDETGSIECVFEVHPQIIQNNVLEVNQCRLYYYKGKQLQLSGTSRITKSNRRIINVNVDNNITEFYEEPRNNQLNNSLNLKSQSFQKRKDTQKQKQKEESIEFNEEQNSFNKFLQKFKNKPPHNNIEQRTQQFSKYSYQGLDNAQTQIDKPSWQKLSPDRMQDTKSFIKKQSEQQVQIIPQNNKNFYDLMTASKIDQSKMIGNSNQYKKLNDIQPLMKTFSCIAKIMKITQINNAQNCKIIWIGDQTGFIQAKFSQDNELELEHSYEFNKLGVRRDPKDNILRLVQTPETEVKKVQTKFQKIQMFNNISKKF